MQVAARFDRLSQMLAVSALTLVFGSSPARAALAPSTPTVTFVGRPAGGLLPRSVQVIGTDIEIPLETNGAVPFSLTGHAYVIVTTKTAGVFREDVYGFYPTHGGKGLIKGPGALKAEHRCGGTDEPCMTASQLRAYNDAAISKTVAISKAQLEGLQKLIDRWNSSNYDLADNNCINFIADVLRALGYDAPPIVGLNRLPFNYVDAIKTSIEEQDKLSDARAKAKSESERADIAEMERDQAKAQKRDAEKRLEEVERRASSIPTGWVKCTCPEIHSHLGKTINGSVYHAPTVRCPQ